MINSNNKLGSRSNNTVSKAFWQKNVLPEQRISCCEGIYTLIKTELPKLGWIQDSQWEGCRPGRANIRFCQIFEKKPKNISVGCVDVPTARLPTVHVVVDANRCQYRGWVFQVPCLGVGIHTYPLPCTYPLPRTHPPTPWTYPPTPSLTGPRTRHTPEGIGHTPPQMGPGTRHTRPPP